MPFLRTPADSSGMGSFLQESVGHDEVLMEVCMDIRWIDNTPRYAMSSAPRQGMHNVPGRCARTRDG